MNRIILLRSACAVNEAYTGAIESRVKALAINGRLVLHSHFPSDEEIDHALITGIK